MIQKRLGTTDLKSLNEEDMRDFIRQMIENIRYLNVEANIEHRDLHYQNIMGKTVIENGKQKKKYKLIDLGIATYIIEEQDKNLSKEDKEDEIRDAVYWDLRSFVKTIISLLEKDSRLNVFFEDAIKIIEKKGGESTFDEILNHDYFKKRETKGIFSYLAPFIYSNRR